MPNVQSISAFKCRMWEMHDRLGEDLSVESCRSLIDSLSKHGQKRPVLGRRITGDDRHSVELIYGARRLFAAQQLGMDLLVEVREIDDRAALIEMDIENRIRTDISPYERGISYRNWLREGFFANQTEIARCLGVSEAQISRLLKYSELPAAVVAAFASARDIREEWAVSLANQCKDPDTREQIVRRARTLGASTQGKVAQHVYEALVSPGRDRIAPHGTHDEVIRTRSGSPGLRVSYKARSVHFIVFRTCITQPLVRQIADRINDLLDAAQPPANPAPQPIRPGFKPQPLVLWPGLSGKKRKDA